MKLFSFFSGKDRSKDAFSFLGADMHSHLLPGVDDGSDSIHTSLELIAGLNHLGFKKLITTSHVYQAFYPNTPETLAEAYASLVPKMEKFPAFGYSAEYFADEFLEAAIRNDQLIPMPGGYVLIEMSFAAYSPRTEQIIFDLVTKGYKPILAHPERYQYLGGSMRTFYKLKELGCLFQLNIGSLGGYYGKGVEKLAGKLMEEKLADLLGTDLHHQRQLDFLRDMSSRTRLMKKLWDYSWKNQEAFLTESH